MSADRTMFTRPQLEELREQFARDPGAVGGRPDVVERLLDQADYALDCASLLDEAVHYPAEPYSDAESLVALLTNGVNRIWNGRH